MRPDRPIQKSPAHLDDHGVALPREILGFYERLRHVPLGLWAAAAESVPTRAPSRRPDGGPVTPGAAARARLRRAVNGMPGVVAQSRRRVLDLVSAAEGFVHPSSIARMKKSALTAALALGARPALGEEDFAQLYAPYAALIPLQALAAAENGAPAELDAR